MREPASSVSNSYFAYRWLPIVAIVVRSDQKEPLVTRGFKGAGS
ncbi:hypothetical protein DFP98_114153 [Cohnella phaseoli]|uniref:Uncharacterized protein n=1 Tax=Cohnella phaseoli TaxID=456490 RepID=A0A3D9JP19_9BACL|nr:hypothetical protein DFP98_114153 [Cohnella phaseoli]